MSDSEAVRTALREAAARRRPMSSWDSRLGPSAGRLSASELQNLDEALALILGI
jgi:Arc/MetJ-type ribon-helix-helix transcriptional regulator